MHKFEHGNDLLILHNPLAARARRDLSFGIDRFLFSRIFRDSESSRIGTIPLRGRYFVAMGSFDARKSTALFLTFVCRSALIAAIGGNRFKWS